MKTRIVAVVWALSIGAAVPQYTLAQDQTVAPQPQTAASQPATAAPNPQTAAPRTEIAAADPQAAAPQGQPAAPSGQSEQAPTIKDAAEYNAYVAAIGQKDNTAKISALEAFLTQYPNSVMKNTAMELLMAAYQGTNNPAKTTETAKRLLTSDSCSLPALALLTFSARQNVATGHDPQQNLADAGQYSAKGLDCVKTAPKPALLSESDWEALKKKVTPIFDGAAGDVALQNKDYPNAQAHLRAAVDAQPDDLLTVYHLALAYLTATPQPDKLNGLFYIARAVNLSGGNAQIQAYGLKEYKNYHGSEEGWADYALPTAKTATSPPADWGTKITKYVPPTPEQQACDLVKDKTPDQIKQLSFGEWELVLSAGTPDCQAKVWDVIKNVPLQMEGNVIEATSNTELHIAGSEDDIEKKTADITLTMSGPIPATRMPKAGDTFDFEGTPASYTSTPFMMMMSDGKLLKKAGEKPAPTHKPPVHHRPAHPAH